MNNENYYVVQGWMLNKLKLKGTELNVYAIIFGFCQGGNTFTGTNAYIARAVSSTDRTVRAAIASLQAKGLLVVDYVPTESTTGETKRFINLPGGGKNFQGGGKNFQGGGKKVSDPPEKISTNNIEDNIVNNINNKRARFIKPTVQEIQDYAASQNLSIDAEQIFDYYEANGWRVGSHKMRDWQAAVRNWARRNFGNKPQTTESFSEYNVTPDEVF